MVGVMGCACVCACVCVSVLGSSYVVVGVVGRDSHKLTCRCLTLSVALSLTLVASLFLRALVWLGAPWGLTWALYMPLCVCVCVSVLWDWCGVCVRGVHVWSVCGVCWRGDGLSWLGLVWADCKYCVWCMVVAV